MSKGLAERLEKLEAVAGVGTQQYISSIVFDAGIMSSDMASCEVRMLMRAVNGKPECVRQLRELEVVPESEAVGGSRPWKLNPGFVADPDVREAIKLAYYKSEGRDETGAYLKR